MLFCISLFDVESGYVHRKLVRFKYTCTQPEMDTWPYNLTMVRYQLRVSQLTTRAFDCVNSYCSLLLTTGGVRPGSGGNIYRTIVNQVWKVMLRWKYHRLRPNRLLYRQTESRIVFAVTGSQSTVFTTIHSEWPKANRQSVMTRELFSVV